jgi:hypothetical protein
MPGNLAESAEHRICKFEWVARACRVAVYSGGMFLDGKECIMVSGNMVRAVLVHIPRPLHPAIHRKLPQPYASVPSRNAPANFIPTHSLPSLIPTWQVPLPPE